MQEKQDKSNESLLEMLPEDVVSDKILSFLKPKELGAIRLSNKRLNFLSKDQYQLNRLLDYINKGKLTDAATFFKCSPQVLEHDEYPERFITSCLKEGKVEKIKFLLDHCPDFACNKKYKPLLSSYLLKYGVKANQDAA